MPTKRFDSLEPERQRALLDAAAAEFSTHGYEQASLNRILAAAGMSKGQAYYYFEDKADLYATVLRDAILRFVAACGSIGPVDDVEGFWTEVTRTSRGGLRYYRQDPHIAGLLRSLLRDGLATAPVADLRALSNAWMAALLASGQAVGAVRDDLPLDLMLAVGTAVTEGFDLWLVEHLDELDEPALDRLCDQVVDLYRRMATPTEVR